MQKNNIHQHILSWSLAFVFIWFGLSEVLTPESWTAYVPSYISTGNITSALVVVHGAILIGSAVLLIINIGRRVAAAIAALLLLQIVASMILEGSGLTPVVVRDIGLLGACISLLFSGTTVYELTMTKTTNVAGIFPEKYHKN